MLFEHDQNKMPILLVWLFQGIFYSTSYREAGQGGKEELFVNIWYSQTWAL